MSDISQDICSTCIKVESCFLQVQSNQPVLFCEEFDSYLPPIESAIDIETSSIAYNQSKFEFSHNVSNQLEGLCSNCENHGTCIFQKQEGGIWQCEEYK